MRISMNWLKEYVEIGSDYEALKDSYNLMSQEVEGLYRLVDIDGLVIGKVLTCVKHPEADKLSVTTVDVGSGEVLQIICGAPNVAAGQKVIVSKVGVVLPGDFKIKKAKIRGIESHGMICSLDELGVKDFDSEETGIYVLGDDAEIGNDPLSYLCLDDVVLELDLTANRPDLLSMEGVAYDTACMLNKDINLKQHRYEKSSQENTINIYTETKDCTAYYGQVIQNIEIKQSPYWLKSRLLAAGIRPINNVVDITNYVMMEYGQPLHAFDYDKVGSNRILVRHAKENEQLITLDEQERKLLPSDIVITDGEKPIALAGVMGGLETEVGPETHTILLEAAYFDPLCVRKTSKRLDLKSESSSRFEKGIDPNKIKKAMDYATELLIQLANGSVRGDFCFFDTTNKEPHEIELSMEKLISVTGYAFEVSEVEEILRRLRFPYREKNDTFRIQVPSRRQNVYGYQDIVEEIVRIFGYDKIPMTIPSTPTSGYLTDLQKLRRTTRNHFVNLGFNEIVSYSLVTPQQAVEFDLEPAETVKIMNPINKEKYVLRHSLIPSLLEVLKYNNARKENDVFLFEIGRAYYVDHEEELLSGLMTGVFQSNLWQGKKELADFYLLKGIIESFLDKLNIQEYSIRKSDRPLPLMHPGISADLYIDNLYAGYIGKLHPQKEYDMGINPTFVFELKFELINQHSDYDLVMEDIPKYPSVNRDIAIVVDADITADVIVKEVKLAGKKTLQDVQIFDIYKGEHIAADKKSVALSLTLQNKEMTLEAKDVDTIVNRIVKHLEESLNAQLR